MAMTAVRSVARRDWYLANLGIVRYVPRDELAATSDSIAPAVESAAEAPAAAPAAIPAPAARELAVGGQRVDLGESKPSLPPAAMPRPVAEAVPFACRLGFWRPTARMAVLTAMPPEARHAAAQQTMLANLLKAINCLGQELPMVDLIDWPPSPTLGLRGVAVDLAGACEFVSVFLAAKTQLAPFEHLLLMGGDAVRVATGGAEMAVGDQRLLACGARAIVTHSLYDMEQNPALKAETWQAIRFLAG